MNKIDYFYCQSYQAFLYALILLNRKKNIVIITPSNDIIKSCDLLKIPCIKHNSFSNNELIISFKKVKKEIIKIKNMIDGNNFHFTHTQYSIFLFILLNLLLKSNVTINFYDIEYLYKEVVIFYFRPKFITKIVRKIILNILYKTNIIVKEYSSNYVLGISSQYLKKNNIIYHNVASSYFEDLYNSIINFYIHNLPRCKCLYLAQDYLKSDRIKTNEFYKVIEFISNKKCCIKSHPNFSDNIFFKFSQSYPKFLPAELLFNYVSNYVISIDSTSLIIASKFTNIISISLIDIVKKNDNSFKEYKNFIITKSNNKVLFPKTIEELEKIINNG